MMMATVLVALMAFAVQSCSSNDDKVDLSTSTYELVGAFNVQKQGEFTDAEIEEARRRQEERLGNDVRVDIDYL